MKERGRIPADSEIFSEDAGRLKKFYETEFSFGAFRSLPPLPSRSSGPRRGSEISGSANFFVFLLRQKKKTYGEKGNST